MTDYFQAGTFDTGKYGKSWHNKEVNTPPIVAGDSVTDAMAKAKILDVHVGKYPMYIHVGDAKIKTEDERLVMTNVPWNDSGLQDLGRSVKWYNPIQNRDYANILDPLSKSYPLMGVLMVGNVGQTIIVQMEMTPFDIGGLESEAHKSTLFVAEDRFAGTKWWGNANQRIVCQNTFNMALAEKGTKSLPNGGDSMAFLQFMARIEEQAIKSRQNYIDQMNQFFTQKVTNDTIDNLLNQLFPEPKLPSKVQLWQDNQAVLNGDEISETVDKSAKRALQLHENAIARQENYRKELVENFFKFNDEFGYAAWTKYALFNATTEFFNHSEQFKSETDVHMYNLFLGDKAKQMSTAFAVLSK